MTATLIVASPALALLVVMAATEFMPWPGAATVALLILAPTAYFARRHLRDLTHLAAYIEELADRHQAATPDLSGKLAGRVLSAVRRLERSWQARADALRSSIAINESLLDSLPDPVILLDANRVVLFSNAAVRQQLGASGVGRDLASLVRDPGVLASATAVLQGGGRREVDLELVDPAERQYAVRIEPLHEEAPGGGACVIAMIDLTAMRRIEQMRTDFIANASHELRTPLSSLIGFIETLRGPARDDAKAREQFLELMHQQAQRMARLVRDLLVPVDHRDERAPAAGGPVDLANLLHSLADTLAAPGAEPRRDHRGRCGRRPAGRCRRRRPDHPAVPEPGRQRDQIRRAERNGAASSPAQPPCRRRATMAPPPSASRSRTRARASHASTSRA